MLLNEYEISGAGSAGSGGMPGWTTSSVRGGWSTPGHRNSSTSLGGSVPSLHNAGSIRSLRSQHSIQAGPDGNRRCPHCHPIHHASGYFHQPMQYYTTGNYGDQANGGIYLPQRGNSYHGDTRVRYADADECVIGDSTWTLGELRGLHRCVPASSRTGLDVVGTRGSGHYYPEGGWGWLVCAAGFLALLLTTGMQLAFGLLHLSAARHLGEGHLTDIAWIGALCAAVSRGSAPLVVGACRRGSTRLTAVIGGLVLALASLFTSFAQQMHQVLLSYGLVLGAGAGLVRETAGLMLGHYFRKRREFVEMVVQAGTGVGIALFSVLYKEAVGKLGWRLGLQSITGLLSLAILLGLVYKGGALLYRQQRRESLRGWCRGGSASGRDGTPIGLPRAQPARRPLVDLSPLGCRPVRMLMLAAGATAFGLYAPAYHIALQGSRAGLEASALVLLQTCLGLAAALGCAAWGVVIARPSAQCLVSRQYLCQAALLGVAIAQTALGSVQDYHGLVLASGLYGASLGGALYSLKMLALERLRARHFAKSWALVQAAEALPILLGVPLTGYMNANDSQLGYYACTLSSLCGAGLLFLVGWVRQPQSPALSALNAARIRSPYYGPFGGSMCACAPPPPPPPRMHKSQSLHAPFDIEEVARDPIHRHHHHHHRRHYHHHNNNNNNNNNINSHHFYRHQSQIQAALRHSRSVPEGLGARDPYRFRGAQRPRDITVIEQMTTSV